MKIGIAVATVGALLALPATAAISMAATAAAATRTATTEAPAADPTGSVRVLSSRGTGCPDNSAVIETSSDGSTLTATYDGYRASPASLADQRKNCLLMFTLQAPAGYTYPTLRADYHGTVDLAAGSPARQTTVFYFQSLVTQETPGHQLDGPLTGGWHTADTVDLNALGGVPCGGEATFVVNTSINVVRGSSAPSDFIAMDSTQFAFELRQCG